MFVEIWNIIKRRNPTRLGKLVATAGVLVVVVGIGGAVVGAGAAAFQHTNTEAFCRGCHEQDAYAEFKGTPHDINRTGVRATCADCHVPRDMVGILMRKVKASKEVYGHLVGTIDTPQKYEAHRAAMATSEWKRLIANDSAECRACHTADKMDPEKQSGPAKSRHAKAKQEGTTCIVCHSGIAHKEPEGVSPEDLKVTRR